MHVKEQIRARISELIAGRFGQNIFNGPEHPITPGSMPGCCVYLGDVKKTGGSLLATTYEAQVVLDLYRQGSECLEDFAEDDTVIESLLYDDRDNDGWFFNGACINLVRGPESTKYVAGAFVKHSVHKEIWLCEYQTEDGNAETAV
jgi:hypothetical protein